MTLLLPACGSDKKPTPAGTNPTGDPVCGNNKIEGAEACDGTDVGAQTCETRGAQPGTLGCAADCLSFDLSGCGAITSGCGNNIAEEGEICDGTDVRDRTCVTQGGTSGELRCATNCLSLDVSACKGVAGCVSDCKNRECGLDIACSKISCGPDCPQGLSCNADGKCITSGSLQPWDPRWSYSEIGKDEQFYSSSAAFDAVGGVVYVGASIYLPNPDNKYVGKLYAFDAANGAVKWSYDTSGGIYTSPAITADGSVIYIGADDGYLYAINSNGTLKWKYATAGQVESSPAIGPDGTVYVGSDSDAPNEGWLYAIESGGTKKWAYKTGDWVRSSPAVSADGSTIYVGSDDSYIYAITSGGQLSWKYDKHTPAPVRSSPAIGADGMIYVGSDDGFLIAIYPNGTTNSDWEHMVGCDEGTSPAIGPDGTVYMGANDGDFYAYNPDGTFKWKYTASSSPIHSAPAIAADGTVYIASEDQYVHAIDGAGKVKWTYRTGGWMNSSPTLGPDGTIYVGSTDGRFYAIIGSPAATLATSPWPKFHANLANTGRK